MFHLVDIMDFFSLLDECDKIEIEESKDFNGDFSLEDIRSVNTGNNCIHTQLFYNNHRIVIQTYKYLERKEDVDIVQGKPELESLFSEKIIPFINSHHITDQILNKLFVFYHWYHKHCTYYYQGTNSFFFEFGNKINCFRYDWWDSDWEINASASVEEIKIVLYFIDQLNMLCGD